MQITEEAKTEMEKAIRFLKIIQFNADGYKINWILSENKCFLEKNNEETFLEDDKTVVINSESDLEIKYSKEKIIIKTNAFEFKDVSDETGMISYEEVVVKQTFIFEHDRDNNLLVYAYYVDSSIYDEDDFTEGVDDREEYSNIFMQEYRVDEDFVLYELETFSDLVRIDYSEIPSIKPNFGTKVKTSTPLKNYIGT